MSDQDVSTDVQEWEFSIMLAARLGLPYRIDDPDLPDHGRRSWEVIAEAVRGLKR